MNITKKILIFTIVVFSSSFIKADTKMQKFNNLTDYTIKYVDTSYLPYFLKQKNTYSIEDMKYTVSDDKTIVENPIEDEKYISEKLNELINGREKAFQEITNEIVINELNKAFLEWKGVKYAWGGDSKKGIDCSALTRRIYRKVFGYELPRVSTSQIRRGEKVTRSELKPGDILFFRPENRTNHTAVYLGNTLFINASSSKGVILSSLNNRYWSRYFKFGVRVNYNKDK